jgi:hypothetical protein
MAAPCSRSGEGDLGGEVGVGGVGVGEDGVDSSGGGSSTGGMATESSSGGVVGRLVDGGDGYGDKDGGIQQERGETRRLGSLSSSLKSSALHRLLAAFLLRLAGGVYGGNDVSVTGRCLVGSGGGDGGLLVGFLWLWNSGD